MSYVEIQLNSSIYRIPLEVVASDRASYYAEVDSKIEENDPIDERIYKESYDAEYSYTMKDTIEARDWLRNNMTWGDVVDHAKKVKEVTYPSLISQWNEKMARGDFEIVKE